MEPTKGEILITGIDRIREGLELISRLNPEQDIVKTLVESQTATNTLKELVKSNLVFQNAVLSMVAARNSRLSADLVNKIVTDFLDVLFDLSQPYSKTTKGEP